MSEWRKTHEQSLRDYCIEAGLPGNNALVLQAFGHLEDLFAAAARGRFRLQSADEIDLGRLAAAITAARQGHRGCGRIIPVPVSSMNAPAAIEPWMTEDERRGATVNVSVDRWSSLARCCGDQMWRKRDPLHDVHDRMFEDELAPLKVEMNHLRHCLFAAASDSLWASIWPNRRNGYFGMLNEFLSNSVCETVLFYLNCAVTGAAHLVTATTPLVRALGGCLPLATKSGEPGTWLVITA